MASLDVLDYLAGLDDALAKRRMAAPLRRQALRDAKRVIEAMAFRFSILDQRPLPEDLDYLRAIEAMKRPDAVALVLDAKRPLYAATRRRRLGTTFFSLGVVVLLVAGLVWAAMSERSVPLAALSGASQTGTSTSYNATFNVTPDMTRLYVTGTIFVGPQNEGNIELFLRGPDNVTHLFRSWSERGTAYLRENVPDPAPGEWTMLVDLNGAKGSIQVDVSGVMPTR